MAIIIPSFTTPQGDVRTNIYAKVVSSQYSNFKSEDPTLTGAVSYYKDAAASNSGGACYAHDGFNISPWAPGGAKGTITAVNQTLYSDGDTFELDDGINPAVTFAFDSADNIVETSTLRRVRFDPLGSADLAVATELVMDAIRNTPRAEFFIRASSSTPGTINLVNCYAKDLGNVPQTENVGDAGFLVSNMSGGTALIDIGAEVEGYLLTLPAFAGGTRV